MRGRVIPLALSTLASIAAGAAIEHRSSDLARHVRLLATRLLMWLLLPFVIYVSVAHLELTSGVAIGFGAGYLVLALTGVLMWALARGPLALSRPATGASIVGVIQPNTGCFGIPLVAALHSQAELSQAAAFDALVVMPIYVIGSFGVGALFGTARGDTSSVRHVLETLLRQPIFYAAVIGLLVPRAWAPDVLLEPTQIAAYALIPLGFLIVGVTLAAEAEEGMLRVPPRSRGALATVVAVRLLVPPALMALLMLALDVPAPFLILVACPTGVNTIVVAHETGLDLRLASSVIAVTTAIACAIVVALALLGVV
jgi:predicted permease